MDDDQVYPLNLCLEDLLLALHSFAAVLFLTCNLSNLESKQ